MIYGAAIPKLSHLSDEKIIRTCLNAANVTGAGALLGVKYQTVERELSRRRLPTFSELRGESVCVSRGRPTTWTDAMTAQLRDLHQQGLSAALIGDVLGVSRNAVIGKAHRLGIVLGTPVMKKPETKPRSPRPPSTLKGKPRPPRRVIPATNMLSTDPRSPRVMPSSARQLAARRLSQQSAAADRALIDAAIAEGKITKLPPGQAWGVGTNSWAMVARS